MGDGPIDAAFNAIERITGVHVRFCDYQVRNVTESKQTQGQVTLEVEVGGARYRGRSVSTDIVQASAQAFVNVTNRILQRGGARPTVAFH